MRFPERLTVDGIERPARNSTGAPIHPSIEGVRNFWRWFGDSKVVDAQGRPMVVYHGTGADISAFSGPTYLTASQEQAADYANSRGDMGGLPNVMPVYVSLQSQKKVPTDYIEWAGYEMVEIDKAKGDGLDGFVNDSKSEIVAFDSAQIKSALGNSGAFDPQSPSLTDGLYPALKPFPTSVFHGTSAEFSTFDVSHADPDEGGIFFTDARAQAAEYGHRLLEASVSLRHPYVADYAAWQWGDLPDVSCLQASGHDGVILLNFDAQAGATDTATAWCVFDASTIELIGEPQVLPVRRVLPALPLSIPDDSSAERFLVITIAPDEQAFTQRDAEVEVARLLREVAELPDWPGATGEALEFPFTVMVDGVERPARNSADAPIHPSIEGVANFWRWFGDSQTVDEQGRPRVFLHGTRADVDAFDPSLIQQRFPYSFGFHFTDRAEEASIYATETDPQKPTPPGANILPVYLKTRNAMVILTNELSASMEADLNRAEIAARRIDAIKAERPFDGVIINRIRGDEWDGRNVIVFDPTHIKAALGNSGAFDPTSPSLTDSHAPVLDCVRAPASLPLHDVNGQRVGHAVVCSTVPQASENAFQVVVALPQATPEAETATLLSPARQILRTAADRIAQGDRAFLLGTEGVVQLAVNEPPVSFDADLSWTHAGVKVMHTDAVSPESGLPGFEVTLPTGEAHRVFAEHAEEAIELAQGRSRHDVCATEDAGIVL